MLLPERTWRSLALEPTREMDFVLADGTTLRRAMSECHNHAGRVFIKQALQIGIGPEQLVGQEPQHELPSQN